MVGEIEEASHDDTSTCAARSLKRLCEARTQNRTGPDVTRSVICGGSGETSTPRKRVREAKERLLSGWDGVWQGRAGRSQATAYNDVKLLRLFVCVVRMVVVGLMHLGLPYSPCFFRFLPSSCVLEMGVLGPRLFCFEELNSDVDSQLRVGVGGSFVCSQGKVGALRTNRTAYDFDE